MDGFTRGGSEQGDVTPNPSFYAQFWCHQGFWGNNPATKKVKRCQLSSQQAKHAFCGIRDVNPATTKMAKGQQPNTPKKCFLWILGWHPTKKAKGRQPTRQITGVLSLGWQPIRIQQNCGTIIHMSKTAPGKSTQNWQMMDLGEEASSPSIAKEVSNIAKWESEHF